MPLPNIIFVMTDNQQAATLGCYGNAEVQSPHIDALAASGMRFDHAYCPNAFCSPCRASALTGMLPSQHGVHSWIDDRNMSSWPAGWHAIRGLMTLPQRLQAAGYRTGLFGKYHLGETATPAPGWDNWVTMEHGHVRTFWHNRIVENGEVYDQTGHAVDFFTDKALEFMGCDSDRPSFAFLPYPAPYGHWPATTEAERHRFSHLYDDCPVETVPRVALSKAAIENYNELKDQSGGGLDFSMLLRAPNDLATLRNYYSQITLIDDCIGRLAAAHPDALIVFTADHGLSLGHHGFWGHGASTTPSNLHLAAHSIPLIIRHGDAVSPGTSPIHVSNMDLFATLLDYLGLDAETDLPSRSFAGLLQGKDIADWGEDEVYSEQEETRVIRTPQWAYFARFNRPDQDELFDVIADPGETVNLAQNPAHNDIASALRARIDAFFARHSRAEADLWRGGKPIQNSMIAPLWREAWGQDWAPVFTYDD